MPITQERMIAVLRATEALEDALGFVKQIVELELERMVRGQSTPSETANIISMTILSASPPESTLAPYRREKLNIEIRGKQNIKEKLRQQRRRIKKREGQVYSNTYNPGQKDGFTLMEPQGDIRQQYKEWNGAAIEFIQAADVNELCEAVAAAAGLPTPAPSVPVLDTIVLKEPENIKHTIARDKTTGEEIERTVKFANPNEPQGNGPPLSGINFDELSGESIL